MPFAPSCRLTSCMTPGRLNTMWLVPRRCFASFQPNASASAHASVNRSPAGLLRALSRSAARSLPAPQVCGSVFGTATDGTIYGTIWQEGAGFRRHLIVAWRRRVGGRVSAREQYPAGQRASQGQAPRGVNLCAQLCVQLCVGPFISHRTQRCLPPANTPFVSSTSKLRSRFRTILNSCDPSSLLRELRSQRR